MHFDVKQRTTECRELLVLETLRVGLLWKIWKKIPRNR